MSADALRWGILGTGGIAAKQTDDLLDNGFTVTAVGSRTVEAAERFSARKGVVRAHGSYEALVADPDVDIVYVATPASVHHDNATLALEAGKHVLLEKPFTVTGDEAQALANLADARDLVLLEALWTRFLPHVTRIHEIIAAGTIGAVRTVIAESGQRLPQDPDFRLNRVDLAGGSLLDVGIYPVQLALDLLGEPTGVVAAATLGPTGVDVQTSAILHHAGGAHAVCHTALEVRGSNRAAVLGTHGRIEIDPTFYAPTSFTVLDNQGAVVERFENTVRPRGMQFQAWEIERLIRSGERRSPRMPLEESVAMMRVMDRIRSQTGILSERG